MSGDASLLLFMSHPSSSQTAEKNLFWGASHCQATKSCSARRENARTESSPLRYYCQTKSLQGCKAFSNHAYVLLHAIFKCICRLGNMNF